MNDDLDNIGQIMASSPTVLIGRAAAKVRPQYELFIS
jgi:hypothetical protein